MDLLRKIILSILILFITVFALNAQDYQTQIDAFKQSYADEYAGDYSKAAEDLKAIYDAESYAQNIRLGWLSYMQGLFNESMAYYQKSISLMPLSIEARLGYALPTSASGNWDAVINKYHEILKIDPQNSLVNYRMASYYYNQQNYTTAYGYIEKVVNLYPFDYDGTILMAWIELKLGKLREAKVLFNKALMIRPNDVSALEGLKQIQ